MKVLSISRDKDKKIFEEGSAVGTRMVEYGKKMEELHITVFVLKKDGFRETKLSQNVFVYPTNSLSRWLYVWDTIRLGKKIVRDKNFARGDSVITCQDPFECGFVGWRLAKKFNLPLHLQIHTDFLSPYFKTSFLQRLRVWTAKLLLPRADGVRVVSKRISESIKNAGMSLKCRPEILPVRIDVGEQKEKPGENLRSMFPQFKFIILLASRLTGEKNIADALFAFTDILKIHPHTNFAVAHSADEVNNKVSVRINPDAGLVIAGNGPLKKNLEEKSRRLGIADNVIFLGWRDDIANLMKSADMFLSASAYEGYGMSVVEAGLAGCPVLSTDVGLSGELLAHKKNSYICPVGDIMCLSQGIKTFMDDGDFRRRMAENLALDVKSMITPKEEYVRRYVGLLEKVLKFS